MKGSQILLIMMVCGKTITSARLFSKVEKYPELCKDALKFDQHTVLYGSIPIL